MRRLNTLYLFAALFTLCVVNAAMQSTGRLRGTVMDITGARVVGAVVTIESEGKAQITKTAEDGTYYVELPVGVHQIKVNSPGFCPARRAAFRMQSGTSRSFDFTLVVCPIVNTISIEKGEYIGETDSYRFPYKEKSFSVKSSGLPLNLLIQFSRQQKFKEVIQYTGVKLSSSEWLMVTASYDSLTIKAKKVRFNLRTLRLEAEENVVVEDGNQSVQAKRVVVNLRASEPVIKLSPAHRQ